MCRHAVAAWMWASLQRSQARIGETVPATESYSPEPSILERKFAEYLARHSNDGTGTTQPTRADVQKISRVANWAIGLSAFAGIVSGGLIGGGEVWLRHGYFDGMEDVSWREAWPYWAMFYGFAGVVSAVEIALLYIMTLSGVARVARHAALPLSRDEEKGLLAHSLARAALEFPNPQIRICGIDPYARVSNWKLTLLNLAYKLKVGVSSFLLRVFLRRVAARMAIRGFVPLLAGPLYAFWNAFIVWRIMAEARMRTLGPYAVDNLIKAHFQDTDEIDETEKEVILHAAGEMLICGRDAHPNQAYLLVRLCHALGCEEKINLDWSDTRRHLPQMEEAQQTRILDLMTVSCLIGSRIHTEQKLLLHEACQACGTGLDAVGLKALHKALRRGESITPERLAKTRKSSPAPQEP